MASYSVVVEADEPAENGSPALRFAHRELGLTDEELEGITVRLGRAPTGTELAMFSVMWSEHCSYKSSRTLLGGLPSRGPHVLVGPGQGAGVMEVAPGIAVAWKIESHNHPSFVEPVNGAATGVGGIVRDVLSMGARPIALLDSLRFGSLDEARTRYLFEGVVGGISSYGNSIGVPTVGGECVFEDCYAGNPLINVACLGVVEKELVLARAECAGDAVVLFGAATGRDGIGGASVLASAAFEGDSGAKRPAVQVGDPFTEKLLIEASLELVRRGLLAGLQDLGAGGISCPAAEMCAGQATGMAIDAGRVHVRETGMDPFEIMISESQERMMAIVHPEAVDEVLGVCAGWGLEGNVIGRVTSGGRIEVQVAGERVVDVPASALADGPVYERPRARPPRLDAAQGASPGDDSPTSLSDALAKVLASPVLASKRWIWEQYDHMILGGTIIGPGGDAAVVRLPGRAQGVALSVDGPGRWCHLDPFEGARLAVAESARNVACVGARPLGVTNCLNLGDPTKPEVMWQLEEVVRGIADVCVALETPVTGGNVSFYNETAGSPIYPTPVIGMLGVLDATERAVGLGFGRVGDDIVLIGETDPDGFGGSEYAKVVNETVAGHPPRLDIVRESAVVDVLVAAADRGLTSSCHDVSGGGLAMCLAECSIAGDVGFEVDARGVDAHRWLFSESPSRAVASCPKSRSGALLSLCESLSVPAEIIGTVAGSRLDFGCVDISLEEAGRIFEDALPSQLSTRVKT